MSFEEKNICPKCGQEFHCLKSAKCWCFEIEVPAKIQEDIKSSYSTCLCKSCLIKILTEK